PVGSLPGRSFIGEGDAVIETVEHLLAALHGMGVFAAMIEVSGPEIPVLDGSSFLFARAFADAGTVDSGLPLLHYAPMTAIEVYNGRAKVSIWPRSDGLSLSYRLHYDGFPDATGWLEVDLTPETFLQEIAPARTFATTTEADLMLKAGLGKGAAHANTVLIGPSGPENPGGFRLPLEPVRHKILDLIGDLALLGYPVTGDVRARLSGHKLNRILVEKIAMSSTLKARGKGVTGEIDISGIRDLLPHRYPFLLVDRVIESDGDERLVAVKNVSINEQFFNGHFPDRPVMPGVLQIEAMCQAAGLLLMHYHPDPGNMMVAVVGMDEVRFRRTVEPGDQMVITVTKEKVTSRLGVVRAQARVNGDVACEARLLFSVVPRRAEKNNNGSGESE
ncbi:MAG: 3-hydroxyacyl-ACP dehydratase FabZ, partial [Planctomycetes bacterium]|nr:3-hydroxyacyl-ACP dehydratase FabZ [Planctomycetota bacterium]